MTNLFTSAARNVIGVAGAIFLSLGLLTVTVAPALVNTAPVATLGA